MDLKDEAVVEIGHLNSFEEWDDSRRWIAGSPGRSGAEGSLSEGGEGSDCEQIKKSLGEEWGRGPRTSMEGNGKEEDDLSSQWLGHVTEGEGNKINVGYSTLKNFLSHGGRELFISLLPSLSPSRIRSPWQVA